MAHEISALVFDAYGTIFDAHSVTRRAESLFPGKGAALSAAWRAKQLEYSWLRSLMGSYEDFNRVTLSAQGRTALGWLVPVPVGGLLAKLSPEGSAELVPWAQVGENMVAAQLSRLEKLNEPDRGQLALSLMDSLMRVQVEGAGRVTLPANLRSFLDPAGRRLIRFVACQERLWLWNEEQWQVQRSARQLLISGP